MQELSMPAGFLDSVTMFINSPPGQFVAGGVLATIVWKFFERVEAILTDQTKFEIAVWLVDVKVGQTVESWSETFTRVVDRLFGNKLISVTAFWRSTVISLLTLILANLLISLRNSDLTSPLLVVAAILPVQWLVSLVPNFCSTMITRAAIRALRRRRDGVGMFIIAFLASAFFAAVTWKAVDLMNVLRLVFGSLLRWPSQQHQSPGCVSLGEST